MGDHMHEDLMQHRRIVEGGSGRRLRSTPLLCQTLAQALHEQIINDHGDLAPDNAFEWTLPNHIASLYVPVDGYHERDGTIGADYAHPRARARHQSRRSDRRG